MGELSIILKVPIEGDNQELPVSVRLCRNLNCMQGNGKRKYFQPFPPHKKFCSDECKDFWNNKTRS